MTWGVFFCNCGDPRVTATNYSPVQLDIDTHTDANRIAQAFAMLHPDLLWAAIDDNFVNADFVHGRGG
jgi:hypothetical protein